MRSIGLGDCTPIDYISVDVMQQNYSDSESLELLNFVALQHVDILLLHVSFPSHIYTCTSTTQCEVCTENIVQ
jgi:hypothetical protein